MKVAWLMLLALPTMMGSKQMIEWDPTCDEIALPEVESEAQAVQCPGKDTLWWTQERKIVRGKFPHCYDMGEWAPTVPTGTMCKEPKEEDRALFFTPKVGPPFEEIPFDGNGPRTEPEVQPADDPSATSNTDPPVAGEWLPVQQP